MDEKYILLVNLDVFPAGAELLLVDGHWEYKGDELDGETSELLMSVLENERIMMSGENVTFDVLFDE